MRGLAIGAGAGFVLAFAALAYGFWGFLLVLVFGVIGGLIGAIASGSIDVRAVLAAARGRRVG